MNIPVENKMPEALFEVLQEYENIVGKGISLVASTKFDTRCKKIVL